MIPKLRAPIILLALCALPALACSLTAHAPTPEPAEDAPTKFARAVVLITPPATIFAAPTESLAPISSPTATIRRALVTSTTAPIATATRAATAIATLTAGGCPTIAPPALKPTGLIKSIVLGTKSPGSALVTPTNIFQTTATMHAIVGLQNAPAKTRLKAMWYANDVGKAAPCNKLVDSAELGDLSGSPFIDFTLDPPQPVGAYRVEILVNGNLDQVAAFSVK